MERLQTERPKGLSRAGLRKWGILFVLLGIFGRSILQVRYLGLLNLTSDQLLEAMNSGPEVVLMVTFAIILQFLETCAVPIFCFLLADGFVHTSNATRYLVRVAGLALITELPYNYAMSGKLLDLGSRNPVFGLLVVLFVLYLYRQYSGKKAANLLIKAFVTIAAVIWCSMLRIEHGVPVVVVTLVFWAVRNKPNIRNLVGGGATMACSLYSPFYMVAPMSVMVLHFYNGEKGDENRLVSYLFYPAALLLFGIAGALAF